MSTEEFIRVKRLNYDLRLTIVKVVEGIYIYEFTEEIELDLFKP